MFQKTTLKLRDPSSMGNQSDYFRFSFGQAKEPKDGKVELVASMHTCREGIMGTMRSLINKSSADQPTDKMRMLFRWSASDKVMASHLVAVNGWVERSIPVLHAFEKLAGWPLTRVYKIESSCKWLKCYYFHSSRRWMKASYLLSLYILLVRMCADDRIKGFKDFYGLVDVITKAVKGKLLKNDHGYVTDSMPYWEAIMKGYPRLFRQRKLPYYWDTDRINGQGAFSEGIQYLTRGDTKYTEVRKEMLKIKNELDAKKKSK